MLLAILLLGGCASLSPKWDHGLQGLTEDEGRLCQAVLQDTFELIGGSSGPIYVRVLGRDPDEFFLDGLPYSQAPVLPASDYQPGRGHLLDVVDLQHTGACE